MDSSRPICVRCGAAISTRERHLYAGFCERQACQHERAARQRADRQAGQQRRVARRRAWALEQLSAVFPDHRDAPPPAVVVPLPLHTRLLIPLPVERRERLRGHLEKIVSEAVASEQCGARDDEPRADQDPGQASALAALLETACAACRGCCCTNGGDAAYLSEADVLRYLRQHPHASTPEIVESYLRHVPPHTFEKSCIFHAQQGCSLPRTMRSDLCNQFQCEDLRGLECLLAESPLPSPVALVAGNGRSVDVRLLAIASGPEQVRTLRSSFHDEHRAVVNDDVVVEPGHDLQHESDAGG